MKKFLVLVTVGLVCSAFAFAGGGKDTNTISIGYVGPLSGGVAHYGTESRNGALLAIEEINKAGGILGKQIAFKDEDDEGDAAKVINAFNRLVSQNKASFVIGSSTSGPTIAISDRAQAQKIILITPSGTNEAITQAGDYIFRACFIDPFQGIAGANFAYDTIGARKAAIFFDNGNDYCVGLADSFRKQFKAKGGEIAADESYQTGEVDFNAQLTKIRSVNPDIIFLPDYYQTVSLIAKQVRQLGMTIPLLGGDGWDGLIDNAGDEALNGFFSTGFSAESTAANVQTFVKAYQARFGYTPDTFSALGYDCVLLLRDAIVKAGSADPSVVKGALAEVSGNYITGNIRYDANRDPIKGAVILEIVKKDGKLTTAYKTTVNP
ncbi:MAG: ABC transporter substrate-binding protein [Spirochaetaceae bacterium]|jgi:branched-chain amino acid transport system substrate-binding protein|nr:ABC transporter substrate-binding protein [Spirochaetaceae bacterium]